MLFRFYFRATYKIKNRKQDREKVCGRSCPEDALHTKYGMQQKQKGDEEDSLPVIPENLPELTGI